LTGWLTRPSTELEATTWRLLDPCSALQHTGARIGCKYFDLEKKRLCGAFKLKHFAHWVSWTPSKNYNFYNQQLAEGGHSTTLEHYFGLLNCLSHQSDSRFGVLATLLERSGAEVYLEST